MQNRNTLFWGIALITLGGLFLANHTGLLLGINHDFAERFWPIFFILGGLALVLRHREHPALRLVTIAMAVAAPVMLFALVTDGESNRDHSFGFHQNWHNDDDDNSDDERSNTENDADTNDQDNDADADSDNNSSDSTSQTHRLTTNTFVESMAPDTRTAILKLEGGAARFRIESPVSELIKVETRTTLGSYMMSVDRDQTTQTPTVQIKPTEGNIKINNAHIDNRVTLRLNATPAWAMNIDMGAGTGDFDLSPYTVSTLTLNAGVADIDVKLGDKASQSSVNIDAGVASVVVRVPKSVGCRITNKGELNAEQLDDFVKDTNGTLVSPGYNTSTKKIDITYEGGLSRFKVVRY